MKPIRLPEPPGTGMETPEIFTGGAANVVRRAVAIATGSPSADSQCLGLVRALGLADRLTLFVSPVSPLFLSACARAARHCQAIAVSVALIF
jgi:hypothetical protein